MSKYTKEQRREIYLKSANTIKDEKEYFCCSAINVNTGFKHESITEYLFPELHLFRPPNTFIDDPWFGYYNDDHRHSSQKLRHIILLLCAEMCND